ncbi:MAG TPA: LysR substrate-binding domain-containing protein [Polyangiaceae bacterium]|nr:LysR substrate-binding domain-containing protein [Polyangiaceae bacterium]
MVLQGTGVAVLPNYLVAELVSRRKLLRLAARKQVPQNAVRLVWRKAAIETSRFKTVRDALLAPEGKARG